ncbi:MAG: hypothetical protein L0H59_18085 [Tomitella sp.]|nr:hypothetical protein [Tomitella sp.]
MRTTARRLCGGGGKIVATGIIIAFTASCAATHADTAPITVPAEYATPITSAARTCADEAGGTHISPEFLAAQLWANSGFDPNAHTTAASGPAQLTEANETLLRDVDGNGTASAYDIADAIDALAALDCRVSSTLAAASIPTTPENIAATINGGLEYRESAHAQQYAATVAATSTQISLT